MIEIKNVQGIILFSLNGDTLRGADLQGADLRSADLQGADLQGADLQGAYLRGAYLRSASLRGASLQGADLQGADLRSADLQGADLRGAYFRGADLRGADLRGAYFRGADLRGAYFRGADLRGADLQGAYLQGADLRSAKGSNKYLTSPMYMLLDQPNEIYAYKLVNEDNEGIFNGGLKYEIGQMVEAKEANCEESLDCAAGINLASLDWCLRNKQNDTQKILICEFVAKDIACIPTGSDGKFRVFRCKVIREWIMPEAVKETERKGA